ncbi:hypothetical protein D1007_49809 [Hordeum vulgare]|nr:hypothetical protein D1007_49809 [Hordeum vulgare]
MPDGGCWVSNYYWDQDRYNAYAECAYHTVWEHLCHHGERVDKWVLDDAGVPSKKAVALYRLSHRAAARVDAKTEPRITDDHQKQDQREEDELNSLGDYTGSSGFYTRASLRPRLHSPCPAPPRLTLPPRSDADDAAITVANATDVYQVKYERLPLFCFSCGCVGHSSVLCPSLGERDAEGLLPYHSSRLCVQDDRKKMPVGAKPSQNSFSKNTAMGSRGGVHASVNMQHGVCGNDIVGEGIPPPKPRKPRATRARKVATSDVNMRRSDGLAGDACAGSLATSSGQKRKEYQPIVPVQQDVQETSPLPMILIDGSGSGCGAALPEQ